MVIKCILTGLMKEMLIFFLASSPLAYLQWPLPPSPKLCKDKDISGNTCFIKELHLALEISRHILHCGLKPGSCRSNKWPYNRDEERSSQCSLQKLGMECRCWNSAAPQLFDTCLATFIFLTKNGGWMGVYVLVCRHAGVLRKPTKSGTSKPDCVILLSLA